MSLKKVSKASVVLMVLVIALIVVIMMRGKGDEGTSMVSDYNNLVSRLANVKDGGYVQYKISDTDSFTVLYNSKNEGILSSVNGVTVYKNNNQVVVPNSDGTFQEVMEITPLGYIELVLDGVYNDGLGTVTTSEKITQKTLVDGSTVDNKVTNYVFSIDGYNNLNKLYSKVDTNFNSEAIQQYREEGIDVGLLLELYVDNNQGLGGIYKLKLNGELYTVWMFDGYSKVGDWVLPKDFYSNEPNYDVLFKDVVGIVNKKVSYGDIKYNYLNSGGNVNLDIKYDKDSYEALGVDKQLDLIREYIVLVNKFNYKDKLGILDGNKLSFDLLNKELIGKLSASKELISLFELYTDTLLDNNWLEYNISISGN